MMDRQSTPSGKTTANKHTTSNGLTPTSEAMSSLQTDY